MNSGHIYKVLPVMVFFLISCRQEKRSIIPAEVQEPARVFVLTETKGYRHESIEAGVDMFKARTADWFIEVHHITAASYLDTCNTASIDILVLLNTTGDMYSEAGKAALQKYVLQGGSVLAIHAAADAEYDWPWYGQMLGAWFDDHPAIQQATCNVISNPHINTTDLPAQWIRTDEWYNFKDISPQNNVIVTIDEGTYSGGKNGAFHPISWSREFDGGRIFYTGMGHTPETYTDHLFMSHIKNAMDWLRK